MLSLHGRLPLGVALAGWAGAGQVPRTLFDAGESETLADRSSWATSVEIRDRSLRVIRDHPLTGIGFDTLFEVIHARGPTFVVAAGQDRTHAHNVFLRVAVDVGLPGLVASSGWS